MPTLTTSDGRQIVFATSSVSAVTDHDLNTGDAGTCIYGLENGIVKIDDSPQTFISDLDNEANFFQITLLSGYPIWLSGAAVRSIREPEPGEYAPAVKSVVSVGSLNLALAMDIKTITALVNAHGGKF